MNTEGILNAVAELCRDEPRIAAMPLGHLEPSIEFMYMAALEPLRSYPFSLGFALGGSLRYRY